MTPQAGDEGPGRLGRACGAFYRCLLVAYPTRIRARLGDEAAALFAMACEESWRETGARGVVRRLVRAPFDVLWNGWTERLRGGGDGRAPEPGARGSWTAGLGRDLRDACRALVRRPALSAAIVVTLGLGIGASTAAFSVIDTTLVRPIPFRDAERVAFVSVRDPGTGRTMYPPAEQLRAWTAHLSSVERVELRRWNRVLLQTDTGSTRASLLEATSGFLDMVGVEPLAGRLLNADDGLQHGVRPVVLAERLWRSHFNSRPDIVGRTIRMDDGRALVVGLVPNVPTATPGLDVDLVGAMPADGPAVTPARAIVWLRPGRSLAAATAELRAVSEGVQAGGQYAAVEFVRPENIFWTIPAFRDPQLGLMVMVTLLLVIAILNSATLLAASNHARMAEFALRAALGAGRGRLARLPAIEGLILAGGGAALGLLVAALTVHVLGTLDPGPQLRSALERVAIDVRALVWTTATALATGLLVGVASARRAASTKPGAQLNDSGIRTGTNRRRRIGIFLAVQVGFSAALLVTAGLVCRGFLQLDLADPGFPADRILSVQLTPTSSRYPTAESRDAYFDALLPRVRTLPGVTGATIGYGAVPPDSLVSTGTLSVDEAKDGGVELAVSVSFVSGDYFDVMGIPLIAGRPLLPAVPPDATGLTPVVISLSLARALWPNGGAVGRRFQMANQKGVRSYSVVGVVGDVDTARANPWHLYAPPRADRTYTELVLRVADGAPLPAAALRRAITDLDPDVPADEELGTAADRLSAYLNIERFRAVLFFAVAAMALVLVAFGLTAVVASSTVRRTREMGIRLALGARPDQVLGLVMRQGLTPTLIGLGAGTLAGLVGASLMRQMLYDVSPFDPLTLSTAAFLLLAVATGAIWAPARRAARLDPVQALRPE